jgi:hypothetical protein
MHGKPGRNSKYFFVQVRDCRASCLSSLSVAADIVSCQQACNNLAAESCRGDCFSRFPASDVTDAGKRGNCAVACSSLCALSADPLSYQTGVSTMYLRAFCPASRVPVCRSTTPAVSGSSLAFFYIESNIGLVYKLFRGNIQFFSSGNKSL